MKAGHRFKNWVKLQQLNRTVQDFADIPAEWVTIWHGRVSIIPANGRETIHGFRIEEGITHAVHMRVNPEFDLNGEMRFLIDDESSDDNSKRTLHINSVIDIEEKRKFWFAKCQELK